jgi:pectinesterase
MRHFISIILLFSILPGICAQKKAIPRDTSFTVNSAYQKIKDYYPVAIPAKETLPQGVEEFRNIVYTTLKDTPYGNRDLHLDLFRPKGGKKLPALIMIHGGGWSSGDKSMEVPLAQQIAARGYVAITVEYQLSPEALYPAAVYNIKTAIRWVRAHAAEYKINADKISVSGSSAGGQLAALTGLTSNLEKFEGDQGYNNYNTSIQAIIVVDGAINFLAPLSLNNKRNAHSADVVWLGGFFKDKPETWKEASPIYYAGKNAPPMLFLNSGYPRFHAGQDELIGILKGYNIYTEVHAFNVKIHPFWLFHPWFDQTVNYMSSFLDKTLKQ